jgi:ABC-type cobalamin/Fe3+-siderophores transport system ATPase subunit
LIGENGAGKTHLLASLARVAYAAPAERGALKEFGRIEPDDTVFPGLMAVSYSAFDTFKPPALEGDIREEVANKVRDGTGRYSYCGMRDLAAHISDPDAPEKLIAPNELEAMFVDRLNRIRESQRLQAFALAMAPALGENSMSRYLPAPEAADKGKPADLDAVALAKTEAFLSLDPAASFRGLSSGHKIVAHLLAGITASIRRRSLVLIDEPETHLHPPLLAALMAGIRRLLDRFEAYAIIATHSPVVAQETLSSQVFVVEGEGVVRRPGIQTFGENTGALTREIFGLHTEATEHRRMLDLMAQDFADPEAVERALGEPLSGQALAFILSKQRNKR